MMETHPVKYIFNDMEKGKLDVVYPYFHQEEPSKWDDDWPDYSDNSYIPQTPSYEWIWSMGDILNSLINAGLKIEFLNEYDKLFYKGLPDMERDEDGWWVLPEHRKKIPLTFTIKATK